MTEDRTYARRDDDRRLELRSWQEVIRVAHRRALEAPEEDSDEFDGEATSSTARM